MQRVALGFIAILFLLSTVGAVLAVYLATREDPTAATQFEPECGEVQPAPLQPRSIPADFRRSEPATTLETVDLKVGEGDSVEAGACVTVFYHGTLAASGEKFDGNYETGQPIELSLNQVIPGWQQGIPGMKPGGVRRLVIPSALAYGAQGACELPDEADPTKCLEYSIPPNSDLVFEVELVAAH